MCYEPFDTESELCDHLRWVHINEEIRSYFPTVRIPETELAMDDVMPCRSHKPKSYSYKHAYRIPKLQVHGVFLLSSMLSSKSFDIIQGKALYM